jgi:hypothetical protein
MIDRRTFIAATASLTFAPVLDLSPAHPLAAQTAMGRLVLVIEGWSAPNQNSASDAVSIRIDRAWRTAWR